MHFLINGSKAGNEYRWYSHVRDSGRLCRENVISGVEQPGLRFPKSALTLKASLFYWFAVE